MLRVVSLLLLCLFLNCKLYGKSIQNDTIFSNIKKELQVAKQNKNFYGIAQKILELGDFYYTSGLFTDAINQYDNSLKILEKEKIKDSLYVDTNNKLGSVYLALNNYNSSKSFFEVAEQLAMSINYTRGKANAKAFLGSNYEKQGEYLKAMQYEEESLELFQLLKDKDGIAKSYENIGSIYEDLMQYDKAYEYFLKAYEILKGAGNFYEANVLNNIGDIYRKKGEHKEAINYTSQALKIAEALDDNNLLESANKDLAKVYALLNNYEKAYQFRVASEGYKEKSIENQNSNKLAALQAEHESHKKEAEIVLLKEQNKLGKAKQNLMLVGLISLTTITGVLFYYFDRKRKAKQKMQSYKERALQAELKQKQTLEQRLQQENKIKTVSLSKYSLSLSQKNKMLTDIALKLKNLSKRDQVDFKKKLKELSKDIQFSLKQNNEWEEFNSLFSEIHPGFSKKIAAVATEKISSSEIKLAMLLRLNLSSKEIASILRVTPDSVRVARHRLRKKLPINSKKELVNFMLEI